MLYQNNEYLYSLVSEINFDFDLIKLKWPNKFKQYKIKSYFLINIKIYTN